MRPGFGAPIAALTKPLRLAATIPAQGGRGIADENVGDAGTLQQALACTSDPRHAGDFSSAGSHSRPRLAVDAADAAACGRQLLARACPPRRPAVARARVSHRRARRMDLACRQARPAGQLPPTARAVSRSEILARAGLLLRLRPAGLSLRLASRPVGRWAEPPRRMALGLRR